MSKTKTASPIMIENIVGPKGREPEKDHHAEILPGQWIRLFGETAKVTYEDSPERYTQRVVKVHYEKMFRIGDEAEYDSYNLSYTGTITSITEKSVTFKTRSGVKRLSLYEFDWRNYDFDAEETRKQNRETMDYI